LFSGSGGDKILDTRQSTQQAGDDNKYRMWHAGISVGIDSMPKCDDSVSERRRGPDVLNDQIVSQQAATAA